MRRLSTDWRNVVLLSVGWLLAILIVDARGEFPTTDDWAYIYSVRLLVEQGTLRWHDWAAANLLSHFLWGALFGKLFGVSYFVMRCSTLVAAWLGALAFYRLARLIPVDPTTALIATILWLFNPLNMSMSFGYMSDIGFAAMVFGALLLLAEGTRRRSALARGGGWAIGILALLSRQTGFAIPIGWAAGRLAGERGWTLRRGLLLLVPSLLFVLIHAAFEHWLIASGRAPTLYGRQMAGITTKLVADPIGMLILMLRLLPRCFVFFGVMGLPLALAVAIGWIRRLAPQQRNRLIAALCVLALILSVAVVIAGAALPDWTMARLGLTRGPRATAMLFAAVLAGTVLILVLIAAIARQIADRHREHAGFNIPAAALFTGLALLGATMVVAMRFDRYLIPIFGCVLLVIAAVARDGRPPRFASAIGLGGAVLLAILSAILLHDQMAEKRLQSAVYERLAAKVGHQNVDARWVLNGVTWSHCYTLMPSDRLDSWLQSRFLVVPGDGAAFRHQVLTSVPVPRWLPGRAGRAPILIQIDPTAPLIDPPNGTCPGLKR